MFPRPTSPKGEGGRGREPGREPGRKGEEEGREGKRDKGETGK